MTLYLLLSLKGNLCWSDINSSPEAVLWIKRQAFIEGGFYDSSMIGYQWGSGFYG